MLIWITVVTLVVVSHRSQPYSEEVYIFIYTHSAIAWIVATPPSRVFNYNECIYEKWIVIFAHLLQQRPCACLYTTISCITLLSKNTLMWWVYYMFIHVCFAFLTVKLGGTLGEIEKRMKTWDNKNVEYELIAGAEDGMMREMRWDETRKITSIDGVYSIYRGIHSVLGALYAVVFELKHKNSFYMRFSIWFAWQNNSNWNELNMKNSILNVKRRILRTICPNLASYRAQIGVEFYS